MHLAVAMTLEKALEKAGGGAFQEPGYEAKYY